MTVEKQHKRLSLRHLIRVLGDPWAFLRGLDEKKAKAQAKIEVEAKEGEPAAPSRPDHGS